MCHGVVFRIDDEIIGGMYGAHATHGGSKMKYGMCATDHFFTECDVTKVSDQYFCADRFWRKGRGRMNISDPHVMTFGVKPTSNVGALQTNVIDVSLLR